MQLGIKTGLPNDTFGDLDATGARACEIWFDASRADEYTGMLTELKRRRVATGIHYWGVLADRIWTTLAYPDTRIITETTKLMRQTIDVAARYDAAYVNIHPGVGAHVQLDLAHGTFNVISEPAEPETAIHTFLEHVRSLNDYARARGVLLTVETVPARVYDHWETPAHRARPKDVYELPYEAVRRAASAGVAVANDFGHTAAQTISHEPEPVRDFLIAATRQLAKATKLVHLGFVTAPYNGTDFHDHLDNPDFLKNAAVPDRNLSIELLKIIAEKNPDAFVIPEPVSDHRKNFFLARELLDEALKTPESSS